MKKYMVQTFGCQMNMHDSRRIEEVLTDSGFEHTDEPTLADVIVVNTCSVREKAEHKLMSLLGRLRLLKETKKDLVITVAGCVAQQESENLLKKVKFLDLVIGPDNIPELPSLVQNIQDGAPPMARTVFDLDSPSFLNAKPRKEKEVTSFVTIMKGCDQKCTFCIVPYTRGEERYRPSHEIIEEVSSMVAGGVSEITLLGQTVNSWYEPHLSKTKGERSQFASLLHQIAKEVPALKRLRYTSPHPAHITQELIEAHSELAVLPKHVHMPVQSGSDIMLRRMLRRYTRDEYIQWTSRLKNAQPGLTLSTDVIVGFPGETEEDFEHTLSLVKEVGFTSAYAFKYSPRPFTPALKLEDDVPDETKSERLERIFELTEGIQQVYLNKLVGTEQQVLVEKQIHQKPDASQSTDTSRSTTCSGRNDGNAIVHFENADAEPLLGQMVNVQVVQANRHSLSAKRLDQPHDSQALGMPLIKHRVKLPLVAHGNSAS